MARRKKGESPEAVAVVDDNGGAEAQADVQQHQQNGTHANGGRRPSHEVRFGRVRVTVWGNTASEGEVWYSCVPSRSYKDQNGNWKTAHSFGRDDLLIVAEAMRCAFHWVSEQRQQHSTNGDQPTTTATGDGIPF